MSANSVAPDQMPHSVASDPGLYCLLGLVCSNTGVNMILSFGNLPERKFLPVV